MYETKRRMTGGVPSCPLVVHQGVLHFGILDLASLCECLTLLRTVGARFAKSNKLYEGNRFVLKATNNNFGSIYL